MRATKKSAWCERMDMQADHPRTHRALETRGVVCWYLGKHYKCEKYLFHTRLSLRAITISVTRNPTPLTK